MKEVQHHIRKAFIDRLNGNLSFGGSNVPVLNKVPSNQTEPFVKVSSVNTIEINQNQTKFNTQAITRIEVFTSFNGDDGGDLQVNSIINDILVFLRTRSSSYIDLSANNFNVYGIEIDGVDYTEEYEDDKTYHIGVIDIITKVEQI